MTCFFGLSLHLFGWLTQAVRSAQTPDAIRVSGICFDVSTAVYLPVDVFAVSGTTQTRVRQSDKEGKSFLLLPLSATSISFVSPTYRTVTLPVTPDEYPSTQTRPSYCAGFYATVIRNSTDSSA